MLIKYWEFTYRVFIWCSGTDRRGGLPCGLYLIGVEVGTGGGRKAGSVQGQLLLLEVPFKGPRGSSRTQ